MKGPKGASRADDDAGVAPVSILDGEGRLLRILPAEEFRQRYGTPVRTTGPTWRRGREPRPAATKPADGGSSA